MRTRERHGGSTSPYCCTGTGALHAHIYILTWSNSYACKQPSRPQRETKKENDLNRHTAIESTPEEGKDDVDIELERENGARVKE